MNIIEDTIENKTAILICSCDKYEDAWLPCSKSLDKYWPDCKYYKFLLTETKKLPEEVTFDEIINVAESVWSLRLNEALKKIHQDYLIFFLEDQWPVEKINNDVIQNAVQYMADHSEVGAIYFEPSTNKNIKKVISVDENYNEVPFGAPYRLSCAPSVFKKDFLIRITEKAESAWEFERIRSFDKIGSNMRVLEVKGVNWIRIDGPGAIARGKWVRKMRSFSREIDVEIDNSKRAYVTIWDILKIGIKSKIFNINPDLVVMVQNKLNIK